MKTRLMDQPAKFEIVCCMSAQDLHVYNYLMPIAIHPGLEKLWIVRRRPSHKSPVKSRYVVAESILLPLRLLKALYHTTRLARRPQVLALTAFNPLPYGIITMIAGRLTGKPVHLGFIGSDWFVHGKKGWGRPFLPLLRRADFITTTGERMRSEMIDAGFDPKRMHILLHSIDLSAFRINNPDATEYDFVFVGRLIPLKRVDTILRAFAAVQKRHPQSRLLVLGDGPLEHELKNLAHELKIAEAVDFPGSVSDVPSYLQKARVVIIASEDEGFPFALVEGMSSGLVPISTPVGTIPEFIRHEENGLLFPVGDHQALAQSMTRLLEDRPLFDRLRSEALKAREMFAYETMTQLWDGWFSSLLAGKKKPVK